MRIFMSEQPLKYWLCRNDKFDSVPELIDSYMGRHAPRDLNTAFPELSGYLGDAAILGRGRLRYNHCLVNILRFYRRDGATWIVFEKDRLRSRADIIEYPAESDITGVTVAVRD